MYYRYDVEAELFDGDVLAAELALGALAPFRDDVDLEDPPEALLDWVVLKARHIAAASTEGVIASRVDVLSKSYAWPQLSPDAKRLRALVAPYLKRTGSRA